MKTRQIIALLSILSFSLNALAWDTQDLLAALRSGDWNFVETIMKSFDENPAIDLDCEIYGGSCPRQMLLDGGRRDLIPAATSRSCSLPNLSLMTRKLGTPVRWSMRSGEHTFLVERITTSNYERYLDYFQQEYKLLRILWSGSNSRTEEIRELTGLDVNVDQVNAFRAEQSQRFYSSLNDAIDTSRRFVNPNSDIYRSSMSTMPFPEMYVASVQKEGRIVLSVLVALSPDGRTQLQLGVFRSISDLFRKFVLGQERGAPLSIRLHQYSIAVLRPSFVIVRPLPKMARMLVDHGGFVRVEEEQAVQITGTQPMAFMNKFFCISTHLVVLDTSRTDIPVSPDFDESLVEVERKILPPSFLSLRNTAVAAGLFAVGTWFYLYY